MQSPLEMLRPNFSSLRDLHNCANYLLQSQITREPLAHHHGNEKLVYHVSEESLKMLDMCGATRDALFLVKEHVHDLQSSLRTTVGGDPSLQNKAGFCDFSRKKMKKEMFKRLGALKGLRTRCSSKPSQLSNIDQYLRVVMEVLNEVRVATISILESVLALMSMSTPKQKPTRRSFILNFVRASRAVASASSEASEDTLFKEHKAVPYNTTSQGLKALEKAIEGLEIELECMFRRMIQTRVSLLNIINS